MTPIAILGWGSLVWDPQDLPHYGPWRTGGPTLPIELSRVSRDCRLTLVIDFDAGDRCPTRFAESPRSDLADAVEDLRRREGAGCKHIGFYDQRGGASSQKPYPEQPDVFKVVSDWLREQDIDAAVWTALPSNFRHETGQDFSVGAGINYLRSLPTTSRENALTYIWNAPEEIDTPLRRRIDTEWPGPNPSARTE